MHRPDCELGNKMGPGLGTLLFLGSRSLGAPYLAELSAKKNKRNTSPRSGPEQHPIFEGPMALRTPPPDPQGDGGYMALIHRGFVWASYVVRFAAMPKEAPDEEKCSKKLSTRAGCRETSAN